MLLKILKPYKDGENYFKRLDNALKTLEKLFF